MKLDEIMKKIADMDEFGSDDEESVSPVSPKKKSRKHQGTIDTVDLRESKSHPKEKQKQKQKHRNKHSDDGVVMPIDSIVETAAATKEKRKRTSIDSSSPLKEKPKKKSRIVGDDRNALLSLVDSLNDDLVSKQSMAAASREKHLSETKKKQLQIAKEKARKKQEREQRNEEMKVRLIAAGQEAKREQRRDAKRQPQKSEIDETPPMSPVSSSSESSELPKKSSLRKDGVTSPSPNRIRFSRPLVSSIDEETIRHPSALQKNNEITTIRKKKKKEKLKDAQGNELKLSKVRGLKKRERKRKKSGRLNHQT